MMKRCYRDSTAYLLKDYQNSGLGLLDEANRYAKTKQKRYLLLFKAKIMQLLVFMNVMDLKIGIKHF